MYTKDFARMSRTTISETTSAMMTTSLEQTQSSETEQESTAAVRRAPRRRRARSELSYKFQRLREKIREAITSGELSGKLPGERALSHRFHCNAKTLSKALTDLAAEGLLERSIGRGTFVKGSAPKAAEAGRWMILCDQDSAHADALRGLIEQLRQASGGELEVVSDPMETRPSFTSQFTAVIDFARSTPESFLRDLVVRNVPIIAVEHEPRTYSVHAVLVDRVLGLNQIARDLMLAGHRRFGAVEDPGDATVAQELRRAAKRYAPDAVIDSCSPHEVGALVDHGVTAIVCHSIHAAQIARQKLDQRGIAVPNQISLAAVGSTCGETPCSGYYVRCDKLADAVVQLLKEPTTSGRPTTLWLAGEFIDRGTIGTGDDAVRAPMYIPGATA
jgi:DNA-binding transcriptional regulator YhcF (GntR family)